MFDAADVTLSLLRTALDQRGIPVHELTAGDTVTISPVTNASVLNPPLDDGALRAAGDNAHSIVLQLHSHGHSILLTGDVESAGMDRLLQHPPVKCDVALAPHHGSVRSAPAEFCQWCSPDAVIVSAGMHRGPSAGVAAYLAAGCRVYHTAVCGAVEVTIDRAGVVIHPFLADRLVHNFPQAE